ncbi:MAG: right-handed parallel beta-helix repeat-containing protein, partial [Lachnospiraceae bacterium]|nr:right-handed parallel beta-helix repeat-containing protein [Lachnospiraceae bacterium]
MKRRAGKQIGWMLSIALLMQVLAPAGGPVMAEEELTPDPAVEFALDEPAADGTNLTAEDETASETKDMIPAEDAQADGEEEIIPAEEEIVTDGDEIREDFDGLVLDEDVIFEEGAEDFFFEEETEELISEEAADALLSEETEMVSEDPEDLFEEWDETADEEAQDPGTGPAVTTWEDLKARLEDGTNDTVSLGNNISVTMKGGEPSSAYRISMTSGTKTLELGEYRIVFLNQPASKGGNQDFTGGSWIEVGGSATLTVKGSASSGGIYARNHYSGTDDSSHLNATSAIRVKGSASLTVQNTTVGADTYIGKGIEATDNANVVIDGATVIGAQHWAVFVQSAAVKLTIKNNALLKLFNSLKSKARMLASQSGQGALYFVTGTGTLTAESGVFMSGVQVSSKYLSCFSPSGHDLYVGGSYILTESEFNDICTSTPVFGTYLPDPEGHQSTYMEMSVQPKTANIPIESVAVNKLDLPGPGKFKDTTASSMSDRYKVSGDVDWYMKTGSVEWTFSDPDEPFLQGETYEARMTIKAEPGYIFTEGAAISENITINGTLNGKLNVSGPKTIVIGYTFPVIETTSQTSPVRFYAGDALCVVNGKQVNNQPKGTTMTAPGQAVIPAAQIPADRELDHWEVTAWTGTTYKTFSFYPNDTENPIVILDQSMDLKAVFKWKTGTPLLSEVHMTIPKIRGGELPAGGMVITTVPGNALKQAALTQL